SDRQLRLSGLRALVGLEVDRGAPLAEGRRDRLAIAQGGDDHREARRSDRVDRDRFRVSASASYVWRSGSRSLLDVLVGALGLACDAAEDAAVDEAVGDNGGGGGAREQLAPLLERQIVVTMVEVR